MRDLDAPDIRSMRTVPRHILQVDRPLFETQLDRMASENVTQILNSMLDAEADQLKDALFVYHRCVWGWVVTVFERWGSFVVRRIGSSS